MSLAELLPTVRSLSDLDKLRLIRWLAEDLAETENPALKPNDGGGVEIEENDEEIREDERLQEAVHAAALRNAVGRMEGERNPLRPGEVGITDSNQAETPPIEASQPYPYWLPDRDYEAAAILMRVLEAEKSKS